MLACSGHSLFLLAININFRKAILDEFFSLFNESADVIELLCIVEIGEDLIPRSSLNSLLGKLCVVKDLNCIRIIWFEAKVVLHVIIFKHKFIGLGKLHSFEEMRQVFIHFNFMISELEAPLLKFMS